MSTYLIYSGVFTPVSAYLRKDQTFSVNNLREEKNLHFGFILGLFFHPSYMDLV